MSADDQQFLDVLSSLPTHIQKYSGEIADYIDEHVDKIASLVREQLASSPWIPDSVRPRLPTPPPPQAAPVVPASALERVQGWIWRHKILTGVVVVTTGAVIFRSYRRTRLSRRTRRARRARNGGRTEVVVIAGSPALPLTRSLSLDMERKGFIVYIVCSSAEEDAMVQNLSRPDVRPLYIDITDPPSAGASIERFGGYLQQPHAAAPGVKRNFLSLRAVILIPSLNYQTSPIATIPPSSFADLFNTHLLHPILTIQAFLPLLTARTAAAAAAAAAAATQPLPSAPSAEKPASSASVPKVLVFTPSIISSINPPFHAPESTVCSALSAFTEVLAAELRPLAIPVTHIQLGTFDFAGFTPAATSASAAVSAGLRGNQQQLTGPPPTSFETLTWPEPARHAYGRNFTAQSSSRIVRTGGLRGSSLRELHNAVFDVIDGTVTSSVVRVGLGADLYGFVGRWVPRGLVAWMMGIRKVDDLAGGGAWYRYPPSSSSPSAESSPRRPGSGGDADEDGHGHGHREEEDSQGSYVAVHETVGDSHVWRSGPSFD